MVHSPEAQGNTFSTANTDAYCTNFLHYNKLRHRWRPRGVGKVLPWFEPRRNAAFFTDLHASVPLGKRDLLEMLIIGNSLAGSRVQLMYNMTVRNTEFIPLGEARE